jgi:hypothetical protein
MNPANNFRFTFAILSAAALSGPVYAQSPMTYRGICDASASVALGKDHFVVADDELNILRVYRRGQPDPLPKGVELFKFLGTAAEDESDIEGAATIGKRTYWISSHGTNKKGKVQERRKRLFATEAVAGSEPTVQPVDKPYSKLLEDLAKDSRFNKYDLANAAKKPPKSEGALNIEGLAATDDGRLLIGFRNPLSKEDPVSKERTALLIPLREPEKLTAGSASVAQFGDPIDLFLENRGIRSIENDGHGGYLIVAGAIDKETTSLLFRWSGKKPTGKTDQPARVSKVDFTGLNPEAMHLVPGTNDVEILSDDGALKTAGVECKDLKDASKKSFRAIIVKTADLKP